MTFTYEHCVHKMAAAGSFSVGTICPIPTVENARSALSALTERVSLADDA